MKPLRLDEIRSAVNGRWLSEGRPAIIESVTTDSRTASDEELFFAIKGPHFDGHKFLAPAAQAGCVSAVVRLDCEPRPDITAMFPGGVIGVSDTTRALAALAGYHRGQCSATVIAITGSNGKTTVKQMVNHILAKRLTGTASPKSFNNHIGVPTTLLGGSASDDFLICEIGSSAPGEVATLSRIARPDIAVITGIAPAHLEKLGSIERIAAEKASILDALSSDGMAVIWADSDLLARAVKAYPCRALRFGESDAAELRLTSWQSDGESQRFEINGHLPVSLPLAGKHNAMNALAAIAVAQRMGFSPQDATAALADFSGVGMRLEWIDCGKVTIINDAYNANPASMLAGAAVLSASKAKRRVKIAGDMLELGDAAEQLHTEAGRQSGEMNIDLLIGIGPLGRYIAKGAEDCATPTETFESAGKAVNALAGMLAPGDLVLLKGSRGMELEQLIEPLTRAFA